LAGQYPGRNPHALRNFEPDQSYWIKQTIGWTGEDPSIARVDPFERPFPVDDVPEFLHTREYAELVNARKALAQEGPTFHYPEPYDAERIYNLNLLDPLALAAEREEREEE
jgi:hypothetical protein